MHLRKCQNRSMWARKIAVFLLAVLVRAQQRPPLHAQSASTIDFSSAADGSETVEIRNISHEVTGTQVPGRPPGERPPLHAQSASTIDFSSAADGSETVEIRNISHEVTGTQVPGRPPGERLLL